MNHYNRRPQDIKLLILDEELTWEEAYTGARKPRFQRYKAIALPELKKCLQKPL